MKKLLITTAAAALAGGAFAAPQVFDFKASVKYPYLKRVTLRTNTVGGNTFNGTVYQKIQKSATLKGYLIQDIDGATSATIKGSAATGFDYGRNRAFLVVMSNTAESGFRQPKILPAVIDAKFIDTNFKSRHTARTGLAEGTLYVGGDSVAPVRPQLDYLTDAETSLTSRAAAPAVAAAGTPGMTAIADYVWTSCFLFGRYNGPNYYWFSGSNPFEGFEVAWDGNLPTDLQIGYTAGVRQSFFHDTWMNGAAIGKYIVPNASTVGEVCCGLGETTTFFRPVLDTLSGNMKGGLFICTDNGVDATNSDYRFFDQWEGGRDGWDAQFYSSRLVPALVGTEFQAVGDSTPDYAGDKWQFDLWQDGPVEQETTDVITGTWSIKRSTKFFARNGLYERHDLTLTDIACLIGGDSTTIAGTPTTDIAEYELCRAIKAAVLGLQSNATFCNGREIYELNATTQVSTLPVVTPKFAKYYGLADWQ